MNISEKLKNFGKYFQSKKIGKILVMVSGGILVVALITGVVIYLTEKTVDIEEVRVTNITGTSATVTWVTEEAVRGSVIYSEKDKWVPVIENIGKKRAYDDRDTEEVEYGEYELKKWEEYYVHHVTLRNLEPNSKYYYRISTGMKSIEYDYPALETVDVADELNSPYPVYGRILDVQGNYLGDSIILLELEGVDTENEELGVKKSQVLSTVSNESSGWSIDIANTWTEDFENIVDLSEYFSVNLDIYTEGVRNEVIGISSDELQPIDDVIIELNRDEEVDVSVFNGMDSIINLVLALDCDGVDTAGPHCNCQSGYEFLCTENGWVQGAYCGQACLTHSDPECAKMCKEGNQSEQEQNQDDDGQQDGGDNGNAEDPCPEHSPGTFTGCNPNGTCKWHCSGQGSWYVDSACSMCNDSGGGDEEQDGGDTCMDHTCYGNYACYDGQTCGNCYDDGSCSCKNSTTGKDCGSVEAGKICVCPANEEEEETPEQQDTPQQQTCKYKNIHHGQGGDQCTGSGMLVDQNGKKTDSQIWCGTGCPVVVEANSPCCGGQDLCRCGKEEIPQEEEAEVLSCQYGTYNLVRNRDDYPESCDLLPECPKGRNCLEELVPGAEINKCKVYSGENVISVVSCCPEGDTFYQFACYSPMGPKLISDEDWSGLPGLYCYDDDLYYCNSQYDCPEKKEECGSLGCKELSQGNDDRCYLSEEEALDVKCPYRDQILLTNDNGDPYCASIGMFDYNSDTGECIKEVQWYNEEDNTWMNGEVSIYCDSNSEECNDSAGVLKCREKEVDLCKRETKSLKLPGKSNIIFDLPEKEKGVYSLRNRNRQWECEWECKGDSYWQGYESTCNSLDEIEIPVVLGCRSCNESPECHALCNSEDNWLNESVLQRYTIYNYACYNGLCYDLDCYDIEPSYIRTVDDECWGFTNIIQNPNNIPDIIWIPSTVLCYKSFKDEALKYNSVKVHDGACVQDGNQANLYNEDNTVFDKGIASSIEASSSDNQESQTKVIDSSGVYEVEGAIVSSGSKEISIVLEEGQEELVVKFFEDLDKDGEKDDDEEYLDLEGINLVKKEDAIAYNLDQGWNLISFPIVSDEIGTAKGLLQKIAESGGYATHVATYSGGKWKMYSQRGDVSFSNDFNILPGVGYFIRVHTEVRLEIGGNKFEESLPLDLEVGWNLVGFISPDNEYTADSLIDGMVEAGIGADTVTKWESGRYDNYIKEENISYGNDFKIFEVGGYFVRVKENSGRFTP